MVFNPPRVTVGVKTNPPSSPSPRGYPYEFELKCNREYVLIPKSSGKSPFRRVSRISHIISIAYVIHILCYSHFLHYFQSCNKLFRSLFRSTVNDE